MHSVMFEIALFSLALFFIKAAKKGLKKGCEPVSVALLTL